MVGDIGGVQAQVMSAAELQVAVRTDSTVEDVRVALWKDKRLVKTWLMRGTLHLLPAEDLPLFTAAMHTHWVRTRNAWLNYVQMNESEFTELIDAIGQALDGHPDAALVEVARRYLRAYGPATKNDFARWFGTWSGIGNAAWAGLAEELVPVSIEGRRADLLAADLNDVATATSDASVRLLPNFDPYLMGHTNRDHLFASEHRARVSRTAGWISAIVLVDGRVVATWTHAVAKRTLKVTVDPFRKLSPSTLKGARAAANSIAAALGLDEAVVKLT